MAKLAYEIVEHDGGWAYRVNDTYSETFQTHAAATAAASRAAAEQQVSDETGDIAYQDAQGVMHEEVARGDDRPQTTITDKT
jgi:hypothetical protein